MLWIVSIAFRENAGGFAEAGSLFNQKSKQTVASVGTVSCACWDAGRMKVYKQHCQRMHSKPFPWGKEMLPHTGQQQKCCVN